MLKLDRVLKDDRISFSLYRDTNSKSVATVLLSAKQSDLSVSRLLSFSICLEGLIGPGSKKRGLIDFILGSSSILKSNICAAKLYSRGEGLSPWACPLPKLNLSGYEFCPNIMHAVLPVPIDFIHFLIFSPKPK